MQIIKITPGSSYSQHKIMQKTKIYFPKHKKKIGSDYIITSREMNYIISINRNTIRIIFSDESTEENYRQIREYIELLFNNNSINIHSASYQDVEWLKNIKNVKINFFINKNKKVIKNI